MQYYDCRQLRTFSSMQDFWCWKRPRQMTTAIQLLSHSRRGFEKYRRLAKLQSVFVLCESGRQLLLLWMDYKTQLVQWQWLQARWYEKYIPLLFPQQQSRSIFPRNIVLIKFIISHHKNKFSGSLAVFAISCNYCLNCFFFQP